MQGAGGRRLERRRGVDELVEAHQVGVVHERKDLGGELGARAAVGKKRGQRRDGAEDEAPRGNLEGGQRLGEQANDLDLGGSAVGAHELNAELRELAGLAAQRLLLAHHRRIVAEARRELLGADVTRDEARDRQGKVRAKHEEVAVGIEELERRVLDAPAALEGGAVLEQRGLDGQVAMLGEAIPHGSGDALAGERLLGKDVTEASGGACNHVRVPSLAGIMPWLRCGHFSTLKRRSSQWENREAVS